MRRWNFLGRMDEEISMKKSRFTEARIMGVLRQAEGRRIRHGTEINLTPGSPASLAVSAVCLA